MSAAWPWWRPAQDNIDQAVRSLRFAPVAGSAVGDRLSQSCVLDAQGHACQWRLRRQSVGRGPQAVARAFSDPKRYGAARFEVGDWEDLITGSPLLSNALAVTDCELEDVIERHTHSIVVGRVVAVKNHDQDAALVHWRGRFETLTAESRLIADAIKA